MQGIMKQLKWGTAFLSNPNHQLQ